MIAVYSTSLETSNCHVFEDEPGLKCVEAICIRSKEKTMKLFLYSVLLCLSLARALPLSRVWLGQMVVAERKKKTLVKENN